MDNIQTIPPDISMSEAIPEEAREELLLLLKSGDLFRYTSDHSQVARFEEEFAEMMGVRYALAVSSCSAALFLGLKALDLKPQARVAIPAFTFAAVPSAVIHAGARPVLIEVGSNYRLDIGALEKAAALGLDALMISHMRGHISNMDEISAIADQYDLPLIEDAAHAIGATWRGKKIGTIGKIGCFSFQSYKLLNAGEGGMLISDDADLMAQAVIMSGAYEHNWRKHTAMRDATNKWQNKLPLYNMRLQNLAAVVLRPQLSRLEERIEAGQKNYNLVAEKLKQIASVEIPEPLDGEERAPDSLQFNLKGWDDTEVELLIEETKRRGIKLEVFGLSKDNARAYWNWHFLENIPDLPQTRSMLQRACDLRLPGHLSRRELNFISDALVESFAVVSDQSSSKCYGT